MAAGAVKPVVAGPRVPLDLSASASGAANGMARAKADEEKKREEAAQLQGQLVVLDAINKRGVYWPGE